VFFAGGTWYARCCDCGDGAMKLFRVDRFETASLTHEAFEPTPAEESLALFDPGDAAEKVTVWFPLEARWVTESLEVAVVAEDDGGITVTLHAVGTSWLETLLLRTGGQVVAPEHLVEVGPAAARRALAHYEA
jgi:predicted DNA-binding transcriptional regulator YafY